jgi:hypothetical protein
MHESDDSERRVLTPAEEDDRDQEAVLHHALDAHPDQLTVSELIREFTQGTEDVAEADRIERAASDLVGAGLLHRDRDTIRPTRAALRFDQLHNRH